jgi:hypothetical protein
MIMERGGMIMHGRSIAALAAALFIAFPAGRAHGLDPAERAGDIIGKYFEAIGGRARVEAARNLVIGGYYGNVFLERGDSMTLYLEKPSSLRRESYGRVVVYDGTAGWSNVFGETSEVKGEPLASLRYYAGFFHNFFSLAKFGGALDEAVYIGERRLGPQREHVVSIPYEGVDHEVHILADSYLVDRIVFPFGDPRQGTRMVNSLRDYKKFHGVLMPTSVVFEVVGREAAPMKIEVASVEAPTSLPDSLFGRPDIRIEAPTLVNGVLTGFIYDDVDGNILTNIRKAHMEQLGVKPGEFITFEVEGREMSIRYVEDIHTGFKGGQLGDCMAIYYQTPLLSFLLFGGGSLSDAFAFEKGQTVRVRATEKK